MPNFIENLGLDFLTETEESTHGFLAMIAAEGKAIVGYYGLPYFNHELGWAQFIENTSRLDNGNLQFESFHTHCSGICQWDVRIVDVLKSNSDTDILSKKLLIKTQHGTGAAVTHVVNADVLPSFEKDMLIHLQMIAFAKQIEYFEDYEGYADSVAPEHDGKKFLAAANTLFPVGLFSDKDAPQFKDLTQICGTVKKLFRGKVEIGEETFYPFIDCVVETQFGDIEILHTIDDVDEKQHTNIRVGATINCVAVLSGDAAVNEYAKGCVRDSENNLKLVSYVFSGTDPERMRTALSEEFEYHSEDSGKHFDNIDDFISFEKYVQEKGKPCRTRYATIVDIKEGEEDLEFSIGTRCFVLAYGDNTDYSAIAFVETNDKGYISKIYLSKNSRYIFSVDPELSQADDEDIFFDDKDYRDSMVARAHFQGVLSGKIQKEDIEALFGNCGPDWVEAALQRIPAEASKASFAEAFITGIKHSKTEKYDEEKLRRIGAQFCKDYNFFLERYEDLGCELTNALIFTMLIGYMFEGDQN